jgi:hypothetical protein
VCEAATAPSSPPATYGPAGVARLASWIAALFARPRSSSAQCSAIAPKRKALSDGEKKAAAPRAPIA